MRPRYSVSDKRTSRGLSPQNSLFDRQHSMNVILNKSLVVAPERRRDPRAHASAVSCSETNQKVATAPAKKLASMPNRPEPLYVCQVNRAGRGGLLKFYQDAA